MRWDTACDLSQELQKLMLLSSELDVKVKKLLEDYKKTQSIRGESGHLPDQCSHTLSTILSDMEKMKVTYRLEGLKLAIEKKWSFEAQVYKLQDLLKEAYTIYKDLSPEIGSEAEVTPLSDAAFRTLTKIINDNHWTWNIPNRKENNDE